MRLDYERYYFKYCLDILYTLTYSMYVKSYSYSVIIE